ncbi:MAG: hypothetical protein KDD82_21070 [Planctomycetes bacterium]|nr:hypothetical protein [Planctomycetota bacterium]
MPELVHTCGKRLKFPPGAEGRTGRCPQCGGEVLVPNHQTSVGPGTFQLTPPPDWPAFLAYLEDRGPAPERLIMPANLMLQTEADEKWERRSEVRWSKWRCPSCKERVYIGQIVCLACGLDFRTGHILDKQAKLNEKGMTYLQDIPWLKEARADMVREAKQARAESAKARSPEDSAKFKAPKRKKKKTRRRF